MSTELEVKRALTPRWTKAQVSLLKRTVAKGLTDDQFLLFMYTCKRTGLDPFIRQIYAIPRWDSKENAFVMTIQTGIDGYRLTADRTKKYCGSDKPSFEVDPSDPARPLMASVTVYKMVEGEKHAFEGEARWSEFAQKNHKNGEIMGRWIDMPFNQLAKCAEAQALRKAFPAELSGVTTHDETPVIDITIAEDSGGSEEQVQKADTKQGTMYLGQLVGHVPKDPAKKAPHRLVIKLDAGGEVSLGTYELPACIKEPQKFMNRRVQFNYEEKPNPRGGEPFRNLTHLALEVVKVEEEAQPPEEGVKSSPTSNAAAAETPADPYCAKIRTAHTTKEVNELYAAIPDELKQDCLTTYYDKLKAMKVK